MVMRARIQLIIGKVAIVNCIEDADDDDDGDDSGIDDESGDDGDVDDCCIRTLTTAGGLAGRQPLRQSQSLGESTTMPAFVYTLFFIHHSHLHPSFSISSIILILIHYSHPHPSFLFSSSFSFSSSSTLTILIHQVLYVHSKVDPEPLCGRRREAGTARRLGPETCGNLNLL